MSLFHDRRHAGRVLAAALGTYTDQPDLVVLALPRGGVPVAYEVARALHAKLDVFVVRKLGIPGHEEFAMGALASGDSQFLNDEVIRNLRITDREVQEVLRVEKRELERRERAYRGDHPPVAVAGKTVILVDDGLATGSTMRAAIQALRLHQPARIIVAVPICSPEACAQLSETADDVVCTEKPNRLYAIGLWYRDFTQTSDQEVQELLAAAEQPPGPRKSPASSDEHMWNQMWR